MISALASRGKRGLSLKARATCATRRVPRPLRAPRSRHSSDNHSPASPLHHHRPLRAPIDDPQCRPQSRPPRPRSRRPLPARSLSWASSSANPIPRQSPPQSPSPRLRRYPPTLLGSPRPTSSSRSSRKPHPVPSLPPRAATRSSRPAPSAATMAGTRKMVCRFRAPSQECGC